MAQAAQVRPGPQNGKLPEGAARVIALLDDSARERPPSAPEGWLELLGPEPPPSTGAVQDLMLGGIVPRVYERWWRPAWGRVFKGPRGGGMGEEQRMARLLLDLRPGDGVLDVACGTGAFTRDFARVVGPEGLSVGLDASTTMLRRAVAEGLEPQLAYVRPDAIHLPFRDASFDAVCCFAALNLMAEPFAALDDFARVLTPGGHVALFTSCARGLPLPFKPLEQGVARVSGMTLFGPDELTGALRERGFEDVHQRLAGLTQFVGARKG